MNTEILTPEVETMDLDNTISVELVKHNITDNVINQLKDKYGGLKLSSLDSKEDYLELKEARKNTRAIGILVERVCKKGRENAVEIQRKWLKKEKDVLKKIDEIQNPLDAEIKKYEDEQDRKEREQQRLKEEAFMQRQSTLLRMGAVYTEGCFVLDNVSFEMPLIKECDNDIWEVTILSKYKVAYEKKEAALVEQERIKKEQEEKLKKERADFEEKRRLFEEAQEAFRKDQEEMQMQILKARHEEDMARERREEKLTRSRLSEFIDIGWNGQYAFDRKNDDVPVITYKELISLDQADFEKIRNGYNAMVSKRKENERIEAERIVSENAAKAERERIEREQREAEQKKLADEQRKQEELLKAGDKVKYEDILNQFREIRLHEMRSPFYRNKVGMIKEKIEDVYEI